MQYAKKMCPASPSLCFLTASGRNLIGVPGNNLSTLKFGLS